MDPAKRVLLARSGPYGLALPLTSVRHVFQGASWENPESGACESHPDGVLPPAQHRVDVREHFGLPPGSAAAAGLLVAASSGLVLLLVDAVLGIRSMERGRLLDLPLLLSEQVQGRYRQVLLLDGDLFIWGEPACWGEGEPC